MSKQITWIVDNYKFIVFVISFCISAILWIDSVNQYGKKFVDLSTKIDKIENDRVATNRDLVKLFDLVDSRLKRLEYENLPPRIATAETEIKDIKEKFSELKADIRESTTTNRIVLETVKELRTQQNNLVTLIKNRN